MELAEHAGGRSRATQHALVLHAIRVRSPDWDAYLKMRIARHGLHPPGRVNFMRDGAESGKQEIRKVGHARRARPRFVRGTSTDYAELIQLCSVRQKNLCNLRSPRRSPSGAEAGNLWTDPFAQIKAGGI